MGLNSENRYLCDHVVWNRDYRSQSILMSGTKIRLCRNADPIHHEGKKNVKSIVNLIEPLIKNEHNYKYLLINLF